MQIHGLKFFQAKAWSPASTFTNDSGKVYPVPANQKIACLDENNDIINLTLETEVPLTFKPNEVLKPVCILGNVSRSAFGFSFKGKF